MTQPTASQLIGRGAYSLADACRFASVPREPARRWVKGYSYRYAGANHVSDPVLRRDPLLLDDEPLLGFKDLVELRFIHAFRDLGVSLQLIRRVAEKAAERWDVSYPFATLRFKTDGQTIFAQVADETGDKVLVDLRDDQHAFDKIVSPYLFTGLEFGADQQPLRWRPTAGRNLVVLDPTIALGHPIVEREAVPTHVLHQAFLAERSADAVAAWYEVAIDAVKAAVDFEESIAA